MSRSSGNYQQAFAQPFPIHRFHYLHPKNFIRSQEIEKTRMIKSSCLRLHFAHPENILFDIRTMVSQNKKAFMNWFKTTLEIKTNGKGLYPITDEVNERIRQFGTQDGICFFFIQHTSASLVVSENYDPTAKTDLVAFMEKLVPEKQPWHQHTLEGSDDSPSHMRAMLTNVSMTIPIDQGQLSLGTWQGIYLFEHRSRGHTRRVLIRCLANT